MFCALLSQDIVSVYRTIGPLVLKSETDGFFGNYYSLMSLIMAQEICLQGSIQMGL